MDQELIAAGSNVRVVEALLFGETELAVRLIRSGGTLKGRGPTEETPLMLACRGGAVDSVAAILERGADPNSRGWSGMTALMSAVGGLPSEGPSAPSAAASWLPWTKHGDNAVSPDIVRRLLKGGADPDLTDRGGQTALSIAAEAEDLSSIEALIAGGARVSRGVNRRALRRSAGQWRQDLVIMGVLRDHGYAE